MDLRVILGALLLVCACGKNPDLSKVPEVRETRIGPASFNIKDTWLVTSKTCNGAVISIKRHEAYKLDSAHFVRVELLSEDDTSLCKIGFVYGRIIASTENSSPGSSTQYSETGTLRSSLAKRTCWKKESGSVVYPPVTEDVVEFGPEQIAFKLVATTGSRHVDLEKVKECPNGILHLVLTKHVP